MCMNIFLGPIGDLPEYHFVLDEDTLDVYAEATDPDAREEGHAEAWTPFVSIHVYIYLLRHMRFKVNLYNRVILIFKPY